MKKTKKAGDLMKQQLAKAVEIGVETVNYWIISYALSSEYSDQDCAPRPLELSTCSGGIEQSRRWR